MEENIVQELIFKELKLKESESKYITVEAEGEPKFLNRGDRKILDRRGKYSVIIQLPFKATLQIGNQQFNAFEEEVKLLLSVNGNDIHTETITSPDEIYSPISYFWNDKLNKYGFYEYDTDSYDNYRYYKETLSADEAKEAVRTLVNFKKEMGF